MKRPRPRAFSLRKSRDYGGVVATHATGSQKWWDLTLSRPFVAVGKSGVGVDCIGVVQFNISRNASLNELSKSSRVIYWSLPLPVSALALIMVAAASIISVKHSRDTSIDRESPIRFSPGVPSLPPFPRSLSSSAAIGMLVTSRSLPPFLFLRLAAIMEFSSCRAWHFGVRSFARSFVQIKWPDGIWSLDRSL